MNVLSAIAGGVEQTREQQLRKVSTLHPSQLLASLQERQQQQTQHANEDNGGRIDRVHTIAGVRVSQRQADACRRDLEDRPRVIAATEESRARALRVGGAPSIAQSATLDDEERAKVQFQKRFGMDMEEMIAAQMVRDRKKVQEHQDLKDEDKKKREPVLALEGRYFLYEAAELNPDRAVPALLAWRPDLHEKGVDDGTAVEIITKKYEKKKKKKKKHKNTSPVEVVTTSSPKQRPALLKSWNEGSAEEVARGLVDALVRRVERIAATGLLHKVESIIKTAAVYSARVSAAAAIKGKKAAGMPSAPPRFAFPESRFKPSKWPVVKPQAVTDATKRLRRQRVGGGEDEEVTSIQISGYEGAADRRRRRAREAVERERQALLKQQALEREARQHAKEEREQAAGGEGDISSEKRGKTKKKKGRKAKDKSRQDENAVPSKDGNADDEGASAVADEDKSSISTMGALDWSCYHYLTSMILANNGITICIPISALQVLPKLRALDLSGNSFYGELPRLSQLLPELRDFDVSDNNLTGSLETLAEAPCLEHFWAAGNQLSGSIGDILPLRYVVSLRLRGNKIEGPLGSLVLDRGAKARAAIAEARSAAALAARGGRGASGAASLITAEHATAAGKRELPPSLFPQCSADETEARAALSAAVENDGSVTCLLPSLKELDLRDNNIGDESVPPLLARLAAEKLWQSRRFQLRECMAIEAAAARVDERRQRKAANEFIGRYDMTKTVRRAPFGPVSAEIKLELASKQTPTGRIEESEMPKQLGLVPLRLFLTGNPGFSDNLVPCFPPFIRRSFVDHFEDVERNVDNFYDPSTAPPISEMGSTLDFDAQEEAQEAEEGRMIEQSRALAVGAGGQAVVAAAASSAAIAANAGSTAIEIPPLAVKCRYRMFVMKRDVLLDLSNIRGGAFAADVELYGLEPQEHDWKALCTHEEALEEGLVEEVWAEPFDDSFGHSVHFQRCLKKLRARLRTHNKSKTAKGAQEKGCGDDGDDEDDDDDGDGDDMNNGSWKSVQGGGLLKPSHEAFDANATAMVLSPWWGLHQNQPDGDPGAHHQRRPTLLQLQDLARAREDIHFFWFDYFSCPQRRDPLTPHIDRDAAAASLPYYALSCGHFIVLEEPEAEQESPSDNGSMHIAKSGGGDDAEAGEGSVEAELASASVVTGDRSAEAAESFSLKIAAEDPFTSINVVEVGKLGDHNAVAWNRLAVLAAVHAARYHGFAGPAFPQQQRNDKYGGDGTWRRRFTMFRRLSGHNLEEGDTTLGTRILRAGSEFFMLTPWLPEIEDPRLGMLGGDNNHMRADKICLESPTLLLAAAMGIADWRPIPTVF